MATSTGTGKVAPDGSPDPSIFSTPDDPLGIQVGTAIATLVRKAEHAPAPNVEFRNLWGRDKLEALTETAEAEPDALYDTIEPVLPLGLAIGAGGRQSRVVRLAGAAGFVPDVVSWSQDKPRRVSGRCGPGPATSANRRLLRPGPEPCANRAALPRSNAE